MMMMKMSSFYVGRYFSIQLQIVSKKFNNNIIIRQQISKFIYVSNKQ